MTDVCDAAAAVLMQPGMPPRFDFVGHVECMHAGGVFCVIQAGPRRRRSSHTYSNPPHPQISHSRRPRAQAALIGGSQQQAVAASQAEAKMANPVRRLHACCVCVCVCVSVCVSVCVCVCVWCCPPRCAWKNAGGGAASHRLYLSWPPCCSVCVSRRTHHQSINQSTN